MKAGKLKEELTFQLGFECRKRLMFLFKAVRQENFSLL
jgi:hypothetical protein